MCTKKGFLNKVEVVEVVDVIESLEAGWVTPSQKNIMKILSEKLITYGLPGLFLLACMGCGESKQPENPELILYCGAGVRPAAEKLIIAFEEQHNVSIAATYAGSGSLLGQLATSRRGDLFMPGSAFYVENASEDILAVAGSRRDVAYFIPTIFVAKGNPLKVRGLHDFADKPMRVGVGDERAVAVGRQSMKIFAKNNISRDAVTKQTVFESGTVNELAVAIEMGNVDAVIVWDANARQFADVGDAIEIPVEQNIITTIPIVRLNFSRYSAEAQAFIDFAVSAEGKRIMESEGYTTTNAADKQVD
jgi:molybdate transport system substrate-binding protein